MLRALGQNRALRVAAYDGARRQLAIAATTKTASDTSKMQFGAPSHVSVAADAISIARQYKEFYSNPGTFAGGSAAMDA